jgi:molybdopterin converting factor small subunit
MSAAKDQVQIVVHFYSFFKDYTGCSSVIQVLPVESTLAELLQLIFIRFPKLEPMKKSMLIAVGVEYQDRNYVLHPGDEVSLFPPVQGG